MTKILSLNRSTIFFVERVRFLEFFCVAQPFSWGVKTVIYKRYKMLYINLLRNFSKTIFFVFFFYTVGVK